MTNQVVPDPNSLIIGSGGRSASFKEHGDQVYGTIVSSRTRQQTDLDGKLKFYEDGNAVWEVVITLATELHEDDEDDGVRNVYAKGQMLQALRNAVLKAGAKGIADGGKLIVRFVSTAEPARKGINGAKQYYVKYQVPEQVTEIPDENGGLGPTSPAWDAESPTDPF